MLVINIVSSETERSEAPKTHNQRVYAINYVTSLHCVCCHSGGLLRSRAPCRHTPEYKFWRHVICGVGSFLSSSSLSWSRNFQYFMQPRDSLPPSQKPRSIPSHSISLRSTYVLYFNVCLVPPSGLLVISSFPIDAKFYRFTYTFSSFRSYVLHVSTTAFPSVLSS
jgi:hypothetical protein